MTNTNIKNLDNEVPKEIRLEVYIKSLDILEDLRQNNMTSFRGLDYDDGLCLFLPTILWDLLSWRSPAPDGYGWDWKKTTIAFPELSEDILEELNSQYGCAEIKINIRIEYLKQFINTLNTEICTQ
jgi:hypothetical protein